MNMVKQMLWSLLTPVVLWFCHRLFLTYWYPSGEGHLIFAYSEVGGRLDVAYRVCMAYIVVMCGFTWAFICLGYPAHWLLVALAGTVICCWNWWMVCSFDYSSEAFRTIVRLLMPFIPIPIIYGSLWAKRWREWRTGKAIITADKAA